MRRAGVPAGAEPLAPFHADARIGHDITNVSRLHAVFSHNPELPVDKCVAHGGVTQFPALAAGRLQKRISRWSQADRKQELDRRVEQIFLKKMDNAMFHRFVLTNEIIPSPGGRGGEGEDLCKTRQTAPARLQAGNGGISGAESWFKSCRTAGECLCPEDRFQPGHDDGPRECTLRAEFLAPAAVRRESCASD